MISQVFRCYPLGYKVELKEKKGVGKVKDKSLDGGPFML